jgi:hypothetical protein
MKNIDFIESLNHIKKYYSLLPDENREKNVTILDIFNKTFSEDYISDYLAYILNPQLNGIGFEPLKKLVEAADGEWQEEYETSADEVFVKREFTFNNGRRIDLLINVFDSLIVGIEHKVFTEEHGNQTIVYAEEIKKLFPHHQHVLIFLTHNKREALANNEFKAIGYEELILLLKSVQFDYLKNIKKSVLYQDFITHLEENFMKKNTLVLSEKTKLYLDNAKMIEDLRKSFEKDYEMILNYILNMMKNHLEKYDGSEWFLNVNVDRGFQQITKKDWNVKGLNIHFELSISKRNLILKPAVEFMIDIEAPGKTQAKRDFMEQLEKNYSDAIESLVQRHHLKKYPRSRTFVSKEYELLTRENIDNQQLLQSNIEVILKEFEGFIDILNDALIRI